MTLPYSYPLIHHFAYTRTFVVVAVTHFLDNTRSNAQKGANFTTER